MAATYLHMPQPHQSMSSASSNKGLNLFYDYSSSTSSSIITRPGTARSGQLLSRNSPPQSLSRTGSSNWTKRQQIGLGNGALLRRNLSTSSSLRRSKISTKARDLGLVSKLGHLAAEHPRRSLSVDSGPPTQRQNGLTVNQMYWELPSDHTTPTETPTTTTINGHSHLSFKRVGGVRRTNSTPARSLTSRMNSSLRKGFALGFSRSGSQMTQQTGIGPSVSTRRRPPQMTQPYGTTSNFFPSTYNSGSQGPQYQRAPTPPLGLPGLLGVVAGGGPPSIQTSVTTWTNTSSPTTATSAYVPPATRGQIVARLAGIILYLMGWAVAVIGVILSLTSLERQAPTSGAYSGALLVTALVLVLWMISTTVKGRFHEWRLAFIAMSAAQISLTVTETVGWLLLAADEHGNGVVEASIGFVMLVAGMVLLLLVAGYQPPYRSSLHRYNTNPYYRTYNSHSSNPDNATLHGPSPGVFPTLAQAPPRTYPTMTTAVSVPSPAVPAVVTTAPVPPAQASTSGVTTASRGDGLSRRPSKSPLGLQPTTRPLHRNNSNPYLTALTRHSTVRSDAMIGTGGVSPSPLGVSPIESQFQSQLPAASPNVLLQNYSHLTSGVTQPLLSRKSDARAHPIPGTPKTTPEELYRSPSRALSDSPTVFRHVPSYEWQVQAANPDDSAHPSITNPFAPGANMSGDSGATTASFPVSSPVGISTQPMQFPPTTFSETSPREMALPPILFDGAPNALMATSNGAVRVTPRPPQKEDNGPTAS